MPRALRWEADALRTAVASSRNAAECLEMLGVLPRGSNYDTLRRNLARHAVDTSHWTGKHRPRRDPQRASRARPLADILRRDSGYTSRQSLKIRLFAAGLLRRECAECGIGEWRGKPLSLHLDHVDGDGGNWELENLRLLCPNCHSQTETYCGRSIGRKRYGVVREVPRWRNQAAARDLKSCARKGVGVRVPSWASLGVR
jgi:5-methylcytosine-specific restriction endonuclease McrA